MSVEEIKDAGAIGQRLFEDGSVGVIAFDRTGKVVRANRAIVRQLGSPDEKTTTLFNLLTLPTLPERVRQRVRQLLETGKPVDPVDFDYVSMHGKRTAMRASFLVVLDRGEVVGGIGEIIDISELRLAEEQLRRTSKMESLSLLAGALAHDLNNIFTTLLGFSSLLGQDDNAGADKRRKGLETMRGAAQSGARLVEQLLSFTSERLADASSCLLDSSFRQATSLFSYGLAPSIRFSTDFRLAEERVAGSSTKIEQVLLNILLNSRDAIGSKGGSISATVEKLPLAPPDAFPRQTTPPAGYAHVTVSDTGCGIPPENLGRIFEPYFTTKAPGRGTGLGLSSVWGILREIGGCARVQSTVGTGTTFEIFLPIVTGRDAAAPRDKATVVFSQVGAGQRILLVENHPDLRELITWILLKNNYKALPAESGGQAAEFLKDVGDTVAAVVMDGDLSMDQQARVEDVLARHPRPVLYLVGEPRRLRSAPDRLSLRKPFSPPGFLEALGRLLSRPR